MPEELAPPVVAVVATADGGAWLEECFASLRDQDYPNLDVLVVDDASVADVTARVAAVFPRAIVRRSPVRRGLPASFNEALAGIDGASFFLFCHDDVSLDPDAVRRLVEESFRSNAAVVGPKLVAWDDPSHLLQVGLGMTRTGRPVQRIDRGELDQAQRDEASEVFAVSGACMLVRSDLFAALEGFDEDEQGFGEDVDLCWRAQVAGARVVVAPAARGRHRLATAAGARHRVDSESIRRRNELRSVLKNYSAGRRQVMALYLVAMLFARFVASGLSRTHPHHSHRPLNAIRWNLAHRRSLNHARRVLHEVRQVSDSEIASRMSRASSARLRRFVHPGLPAHPGRGAHLAGELVAGATPLARPGSGRGSVPGSVPESVPAEQRRLSPSQLRAQAHADLDAMTAFMLRLRTGEISLGPIVAGTVLAVFLVAGLRGLLFTNLPLVGQLVPLPTASVLLGRYFSGALSPGWSLHAGVTPPGYAVVGLLGLLLGNSSALALKLLLVSGVSVGTVGAAKLVRPFGSRWAMLIAAVAFGTSPFAWNAMAHGDVSASVALAAAPFLLLRLARATGLEPFSQTRRLPSGKAGRSAGRTGDQTAAQLVGDPGVETGTRRLRSRGRSGARRIGTEIAGLALLAAVAASFAPAVLLVVAAAWICLAAFLVVTSKAPRRVLVASARAGCVAIGGLAGAVAIMMPWSVAWLVNGSSWSLLTGARGVTTPSIGPLADLVGHLGPFGSFWGVLGVLVAASAVLAIGSGDELAWGGGFLAVGIGAAGFAFAGGRGLLGEGFGDSITLSAMAAAALPAAVGVSAAAVERQLGRHAFGVRHLVAALAAVALAVSIVTGLGAFTSGRAALPATGYDQYLSWTGSSSGAPHGARTLWIGQPEALPGAAVQVRPGLAAFVTPAGLPTVDQLFPAVPSAPLAAVVGDVRRAGATAQLGAELAAEGIRYIVVPSSVAPQAGGSGWQSAPPPGSLVGTLQAQTDLQQRITEAGVLVFQNTSWTPSDGNGPANAYSASGKTQLRPGFPSERLRLGGLALALLALALALVDLLGFHRGRHTARKNPRSLAAGATA